MEAIIKQLKKLGYTLTYEYNPMTQLVEYRVWCEGEIVDLGQADEITFSDRLKEILDEAKGCK